MRRKHGAFGAGAVGAVAGVAVSQLARAVLAQGSGTERLVTTPTVQGGFWTLVVPLLLLVVSFGSAYALYRHFSTK